VRASQEGRPDRHVLRATQCALEGRPVVQSLVNHHCRRRREEKGGVVEGKDA